MLHSWNENHLYGSMEWEEQKIFLKDYGGNMRIASASQSDCLDPWLFWGIVVRILVLSLTLII